MESIEYESLNITGTTLLAKHACELVKLIPRGGGNIGYMSVYDGVDTNGELKMRLKVPNNNSKPFVFNPHVYLRMGLYIVFEENIDDCFVQWKLRPKGES